MTYFASFALFIFYRVLIYLTGIYSFSPCFIVFTSYLGLIPGSFVWSYLIFIYENTLLYSFYISE